MVEESESSIAPTRNGPYLVKNLKKLKNSKNEEIKSGSVITLCRCGGSNSKPFCDGQHWYVKFKDEKN